MPNNQQRYSLFIFFVFILIAGCSRRLYLPIAAKQWQSSTQNQADQLSTTPVFVQSPSLTPPSVPPIQATPTPTLPLGRLVLPLLKKSENQVTFNWQLTPHSLQGKHDNPRAILQIQYPVVSGDSNPVLEGLNQQVQDWINLETNHFLQLIQSLQPGLSDGFLTATYNVTTNPTWSLIHNNPLIPTNPVVYEGNQAVFDGGKPVVSLLFLISEYSGGAHPFDQHYAINYDLATGEQITLDDLFRPDKDYLSTIADYASKELHLRQDLPTDQINSGTAPSVENYKIWNITPQGLLITFEEYQVGPYSAGPQMVLIPFDALSSLLSPVGPLSNYAKSGS